MLDKQWWLVHLVHRAFQSLTHKQKMQDVAHSYGVNSWGDLLAKIQFRPKAELAQKPLPCNKVKPAKNWLFADLSGKAASFPTSYTSAFQ